MLQNIIPERGYGRAGRSAFFQAGAYFPMTVRSVKGDRFHIRQIVSNKIYAYAYAFVHAAEVVDQDKLHGFQRDLRLKARSCALFVKNVPQLELIVQ